jgi:outer membrane protein W
MPLESADGPGASVKNNHWADGRGTVVSVGLDHSLGKNWSLGAAIDYTSYTANHGTDQVNFADAAMCICR